MGHGDLPASGGGSAVPPPVGRGLAWRPPGVGTTAESALIVSLIDAFAQKQEARVTEPGWFRPAVPSGPRSPGVRTGRTTRDRRTSRSAGSGRRTPRTTATSAPGRLRRRDPGRTPPT